MPRLTDATVAQVKPTTARRELPDAIVVGLRLVVQPSGFKSWVCRYRLGRRQVKLTLGPYPRLPLAAARDAARRALGAVAIGTDPSATKRGATPGDGSIEATVAEYQAKRLPELRPDTRAATIRELGLMADAWAGRALRSISRADVRKLIDDAQMRGPAAANMVRNRVSAFLSWCAERDLIESSPAAGIKRPNKPVTRDRVLSDAELAAVWRGAHSTGRCGAAVQLLILTGCRRSEVYQLEWTEVGADAISLPAARTKSNVARSIPITRAMRAILDAQGATGRYVFGAHRPVPSGAWCKTMLDAAVAPGAVAPWTIHDLRRTFATGCAALGVAPHIIERAIGHSVGSTVMQIYQRFEHGPEVADAFARWSEHVQKITRP